MAQITVNVDTETKSLQVLIDGEIQQNVQEVNLYLYEDYPGSKPELSTRITSVKKNPDNGITTITYLMAKESKEGQLALATGGKLHKKYSDLIESDNHDKVKNDIVEYFSRP